MFKILPQKPNNFTKNDLIKYNDDYYLIIDILNNNSSIEKLVINYINKPTNKEQTINSNDIKIKTIRKADVATIISFLKFIDIYNLAISFINKRSNTKFSSLDNKRVDEYIDIFNKKINLSMNSSLYQILHHIKKSKNSELQICNIIINPFKFILEDKYFITYKKAEKICDQFNLSINFEDKCIAWTNYTILSNTNSFYKEIWKFNNEFVKFCQENKKNNSEYRKYINQLLIEKKINGKNYITSKYLFKKEKETTDLTMDLFYERTYVIPKIIIENYIIQFELYTTRTTTKEFKFEPEQKNSIIDTFLNKLSIITGPPGTGKTAVIQCYLYINNLINKENKKNVMPGIFEANEIGLLAPTGLAFINMKDAITSGLYNKEISGTCHKIIYDMFSKILQLQHKKKSDYTDDDYELSEIKLLCIIVDEASMLDLLLFNKLLEICDYFNSKLILLGDIKQLQSIGPGTVLKSLIECNLFSVTNLKTIKRQNMGSLKNCITKMTNEEIVSKEDFDNESLILIEDDIYDLPDFIYRLIKNYNLQNCKYLCYNKSEFNSSKKPFKFNTSNLNKYLQEIYNPSDNPNEIIPPPYNNYTLMYSVGDKIVRTENDYSSDKFRANGESAIIISYIRETIKISYNDEPEEEISVKALYEEHTLNYAVNFHKSQGSQYNTVVIFIEPEFKFIDINAIYTAISRSQQRCIIISQMSDFMNCQKTGINEKVSLFMKESDNYEF